MAITPIFNKLRVQGGTFYTFQPATKDLTLTFSNDDNIKFNFSKFVCIKLPYWAQVTKQSMYINPNFIESIVDNSAMSDANTFFVKTYLQNYAENLNTILDNYRVDDNFANTAEMSFFKALSSKFHNAQPPFEVVQHSTYLDSNNVTRNVFKEKAASAEYEPIIQYIGDINMINHVTSEGNEYVEVYGHIPTEAGKINNLKFIENLQIHETLAQVPANSGEQWIQGQKTAYETKLGSYAKAVYDTATNKYDVSTDYNKLTIHWDDIEKHDTDVTQDNGNFEFNAILVYYDIFDKTNQTTASRNLYGILILNPFDLSSPNNLHIPTFKKYQPNEHQSGNSYGFRFNLMFSNSSNIVTTAEVVNSYSTYSMELYMHALERLKSISLQSETALLTANEIYRKYNNLHSLILSIETQSGQKAALEAANKALEATNRLVSSSNWFPVENYVIHNGKILKKLVDYAGGAGTKPTLNVGKYFANAGFTDNPDEAIDFRH